MRKSIMKNPIDKFRQLIPSKFPRAAVLIGLIGVLGAAAAEAAITDPNPMCARFAGDTSIFGSDGLGVYTQTGDVLCGSAGQGFVLTTTYAKQSQRRAWIDLKNAVQYNNPPISAKSLPQGLVEVELLGMTPSNPDGSCIPGAVGSPLDMIPGETYLSALRIRIFAGSSIYDLRFGQPYCEAVASPCPVIVTAGEDADLDGFADVWTIEPSAPDATAILFKGKPRWDVPPGAVIGAFKVPFSLIFSREQFCGLIGQIE